jgi:hypothetical protein
MSPLAVEGATVAFVAPAHGTVTILVR